MVLLGTAICEVYVNNIRCSARALFDPGSQASFTPKLLQRKICIPTFSTPTAEVAGLSGSVNAIFQKYV